MIQDNTNNTDEEYDNEIIRLADEATHFMVNLVLWKSPLVSIILVVISNITIIFSYLLGTGFFSSIILSFIVIYACMVLSIMFKRFMKPEFIETMLEAQPISEKYTKYVGIFKNISKSIWEVFIAHYFKDENKGLINIGIAIAAWGSLGFILKHFNGHLFAGLIVNAVLILPGLIIHKMIPAITEIQNQAQNPTTTTPPADTEEEAEKEENGEKEKTE